MQKIIENLWKNYSDGQVYLMQNSAIGLSKKMIHMQKFEITTVKSQFAYINLAK